MALQLVKRGGKIWEEAEVARRIGAGNAVVIGGKVLCAGKGKISSETEDRYFLLTFDRVSLDDSTEAPHIDSPFDDLEGEEP